MDIIKSNQNLPATVDELHEFLLINKEKLKAHQAKIRAIDKVGSAHAAKEAALLDGQDLAEVLIDAEAKLGEMLAAIPDKEASSAKGIRSLPPGITKKESHFAQEISKHPEIAETIKAKAREEDRLVTSREVSREIQKEKRVEQKQKENLSLPDDKFKVIYADPPWKYGDQLIEGYGAASHHYPQMSIDELCKMKVSILLTDTAVLFLWVTSPLLAECWPVIESWGFQYKASFVWDKVKHNYGHYSSVRHEYLFICTKGSCLPEWTPENSVFSIERTGHSQKPEKFRELIDRMYPYGERLELFARGELPENWRAWGDESDSIL